MTRKLVECVPNFSEGRDPAVVQAIVDAIASAGVAILDRSMDEDHHRSVVTFAGTPVAIEAESRLRDIQALERRLALKCRDGNLDRLILLINDTAANRHVLGLHRGGLRERFPLAGRDVLAAVTKGEAPSANGILLL